MLMGVLLACCARRARPMVCAARFGAQGRRAVGGAQCRAVGGGAAGDGAASASWLVIDGNSLIYRSFHGMPPLTSTKNNQPVGSVLGVTMALFRVALPYLFAGARVVFVLDPEEKGSWRKDLDPSYKSQRSPMPPMLKLQYNDAVGVAAAFGVSVVFVNGQEADDVLATLASRHRASGVDVWSGDKDLLQLVDMPGVRCLDYSGAHVDEAAVMVKFGVKASQIGDYLALASDNVKGVAGIGAKGAAALLTAFGDLKTILERAPTSDLKTRIRNAVINADLEQLAISRQLVELNRDVELPDEYHAPHEPRPANAQQLMDLLLEHADRYGFAAFRSLVLRELAPRVHDSPAPVRAPAPPIDAAPPPPLQVELPFEVVSSPSADGAESGGTAVRRPTKKRVSKVDAPAAVDAEAPLPLWDEYADDVVDVEDIRLQSAVLSAWTSTRAAIAVEGPAVAAEARSVHGNTIPF